MNGSAAPITNKTRAQAILGLYYRMRADNMRESGHKLHALYFASEAVQHLEAVGLVRKSAGDAIIESLRGEAHLGESDYHKLMSENLREDERSSINRGLQVLSRDFAGFAEAHEKALQRAGEKPAEVATSQGVLPSAELTAKVENGGYSLMLKSGSGAYSRKNVVLQQEIVLRAEEELESGNPNTTRLLQSVAWLFGDEEVGTQSIGEIDIDILMGKREFTAIPLDDFAVLEFGFEFHRESKKVAPAGEGERDPQNTDSTGQ